MKTDHHSHSAPALPPDLRLSAIGRRVSTSGPMAAVLVDLCYGLPKRDHVEAVHLATMARVADAIGMR